jgi:DnaJ-class molecular chaperone
MRNGVFRRRIFMAMQYKDYYATLGISRDADIEEVRRAFRRLARLCHPDITGNDRRAEERFKEINEAYEVLGDAERRRRYDEFNATWEDLSSEQAWQRFTSQIKETDSSGAQDQFTYRSGAFRDLFEQISHLRHEAARARQKEREARMNEPDGRGDDLEADISVSLEEVAAGAMRTITMRRASRCPECLGLGQVRTEKCAGCRGAGTVPATIRCTVKIPAGVKEGAFLRVTGKGDEGAPGFEPGDLYLKVQYAPHPSLKFENGKLIADLCVAPWEAVLGSSARVPSIDGHVSIRVPAGTQSGQLLRVKGRGLPSAEGGRGDLFVRVRVQLPAGAHDRDRKLWEELARQSGNQGAAAEQSKN